MNSFENPHSPRIDEEMPSTGADKSPAVTPETTIAEDRGSVSEKLFDELQLRKHEALNQLFFSLDKPPQPEGALSQMLRQISDNNPYANRLLATLGYDNDLHTFNKDSGSQNEQIVQSITLMLQMVGQHAIEDVLAGHAKGDGDLAKRLNDLTNRMQRGASSLIEGRFNPLSGYFQKVVISEDGTVQQRQQQDRERWAKAVLWQAPGVGELPELHVSEVEQQELLAGYLSATLALAPQRQSLLNDLPELIALSASEEDRSSATIKQHFGDSLAFVRSQVVDQGQRGHLDHGLNDVGITWSEDLKRYEVTF